MLERTVAAELFSSGICNLSCRYCYIPKDKKLNQHVQKKILDDLSSGELLKRLERVYGTRLQTLAHWGSEPTLTLDKFEEFYKEAFNKFPNLKHFSLSSNFMTNPSMLLNFIDRIPKINDFIIDIQMSVDGPPWITDKNRTGGSTKKMIKNILSFLSGVKEVNKNLITMHFKPTISRYSFDELLNPEKIYDYFRFFNEVLKDMYKIDYGNVKISNLVDPTLVTPDDYTKEDGLKLTEIFKLISEVKENNTEFKKNLFDQNIYLDRIVNRISPFISSFFTKQRMFPCSAGDSCLGINYDDKIHMCHRSYYMDDIYVDNALMELDTILGNKDNINYNRHNLIKKWYIQDINDKLGLSRFQYVSFGNSDFVYQKGAISNSIIRELAYMGELSPCYKNSEMANLFSIFTIVNDCKMDNVLFSGSTLISSSGFYRLFGNGAFEFLLKKAKENL